MVDEEAAATASDGTWRPVLLLGWVVRVMGGLAVVSFALGRLMAASVAFAGVPRVPVLCVVVVVA